MITAINMKKFLTTFFYYWWKPAIVVAIGFFIFAIGGFTYSRFWETVCTSIFGFTLLLLLISFIFQLVRRESEEALYTGFSFFGVLVVLFFYGIILSFLNVFVPDGYADNLKIPDNIEISEPVPLNFSTSDRPDSILNIKRSSQDFQLYQSFQPGLYEYDVWLKNIGPGTVYLKAYEITQNDALTTKYLPKTSSISVNNPTDSIIRFGTAEHFTIYEGDFDKPYAARFEVWFRAEEGGELKKLFTKNYKIEGWMH
jgi:hypothetical protein